MKNIIEILNRSKVNLVQELGNIDKQETLLTDQITVLREDRRIINKKIAEVDQAVRLLEKGNTDELTSKSKKTKS